MQRTHIAHDEAAQALVPELGKLIHDLVGHADGEQVLDQFSRCLGNVGKGGFFVDQLQGSGPERL